MLTQFVGAPVRKKLRLPNKYETLCGVMVFETVMVVERDMPARLAVMTTGEAEAAPSVTDVTAWRGGYPVGSTVAGTGTAAGFELVRLTLPEKSASVFRITLIWIDLPVVPYGGTLIELSPTAGVSVSRADALPFGSDAVIVDVVVVATAAACTGNVTRRAPAGTRSVAGTLIMGVLELVRETERPPAGAGSLRATVPTRSAGPKMLSTGPR